VSRHREQPHEHVGEVNLGEGGEQARRRDAGRGPADDLRSSQPRGERPEHRPEPVGSRPARSAARTRWSSASSQVQAIDHPDLTELGDDRPGEGTRLESLSGQRYAQHSQRLGKHPTSTKAFIAAPGGSIRAIRSEISHSITRVAGMSRGCTSVGRESTLGPLIDIDLRSDKERCRHRTRQAKSWRAQTTNQPRLRGRVSSMPGARGAGRGRGRACAGAQQRSAL